VGAAGIVSAVVGAYALFKDHPAPTFNPPNIIFTPPSPTVSEPAAPAPTGPAQELTRASLPASSGPIGWVYYEVGEDGGLTSDGRLESYPFGDSMPEFSEIASGTIFRAASGINVRSIPPETFEEQRRQTPIGSLRPGDCVVVTGIGFESAISDPDASSGGWLEVARRPCP
jgi:hypothetical protein